MVSLLFPLAFFIAADPDLPNIVFILADDQRASAIGALGQEPVATPNLDRLMARGFHFTNAYCMGSMVPAVCLPSRSMILTGRSLWRLPENLRAKESPDGVVTLAEIMKSRGYVTMHSGKAGNSCSFAHHAFDVNVESNDRTAESATFHVDKVLDFLSHEDGRRPFFVYLAPPVPHDPRLAPPSFRARYDAQTIPLPRNFLPRHPFDNGELKVRDELLAALPRDPVAMREHLAEYYATITHLDHEMGRLFTGLEEKGIRERTIIVFASDQGLAVGGCHGLMGKQNLYEHFKSPLIVAGPGIPRGESSALVYLLDLFPTLATWAGASLPGGTEGTSLIPVIEGEVSSVRSTLVAAYRGCQRMARDERWKLIEYRAKDGRHEQLFDLQQDPFELVNLAEDNAHAATRARLRDVLRSSLSEWGDPIPWDEPITTK